MNRHEGVSCDACLKGNFRGRRYKCLLCFDYDLCAQCYEQGATTTRHTTDHPMQCILTRADYELYYGGEVITMDQPQSYTCPYCNTMGYTDIALQEHVSSEHSDASFEVVCPVCASMIGGDPNMVTDDLAAHLTVEHRAGSAAASNSGPRDLISFLDEPNASAGTSVISRHGVRRTPHGTRGVGVGGPRARRNNMHFSSSGGLASLSPSARDTVDPIAELLSQLSGVRRSAGNNASVAGNHATNNPTQLQQLQMQLQLERQQVARQQLERLPRRQAASVTSANSADRSNAGSITSSAVSVSVSGSSAALAPPPGIVPSTNSKPISDQNAHAPSVNFSNQFLLATTIDEPLSEEAQEKLERLRANRSQFVQEILLASVAETQGRPPRSKVKESNSSSDKTEKENLVKDKSVTTSQNQSRCNKTKGPRGRGRPSSSGEPVTSNNTDEGAKGCDRRTGENVNRSKNMQATKGPSPR